MYCNGACCFCSVPCTKKVPIKETENTEENLGTYEIKRTFLGKDKVRKVKDESRTLGIEYTTR